MKHNTRNKVWYVLQSRDDIVDGTCIGTGWSRSRRGLTIALACGPIAIRGSIGVLLSAAIIARLRPFFHRRGRRECTIRDLQTAGERERSGRSEGLCLLRSGGMRHDSVGVHLEKNRTDRTSGNGGMYSLRTSGRWTSKCLPYGTSLASDNESLLARE